MRELLRYEIIDQFPHAIIENNVTIENGAMIGKNAVICSGAIIETDAIISINAVIRTDTIIKSGAIIGANTVIKSNAIIEKGNEGITIIGMYRHIAGCYFDSKSKEIIIRLDYNHKTIEEWDKEFNNGQDKYHSDPEDQEKRKNTYEFLKNYALNYNWRK
jgi:carbonic anhydrase/acetyltransferase-like protein (isoleucine patch superfamily)